MDITQHLPLVYHQLRAPQIWMNSMRASMSEYWTGSNIALKIFIAGLIVSKGLYLYGRP